MQGLYRIACLLLALSGPGLALAADNSGSAERHYHEGSQYQRVDPPEPLLPGREGGRVEVVEMFFYACPPCYELDPKMREWASDRPWVEFRRVPAIVGPTWADQARAYYIAEELGMLDKVHGALFDSIHKDGEQYYNEYMITKFLVEQGADPQQVYDLYRSQKITDKVSRARELTVRYRLRGVPAVTVNGKYVTAPYFVRNQEEMIEVLDFLVEKERQEKLSHNNRTGG